VGIPRTQGLLYSPWQPLGIPFAITPIGQLFLGFRRPNLITGLSGWRTPDKPLRTQHKLSELSKRVRMSQGCVYPSIDLVCCRNIWKETHKLLDPDKLSVENSLSVSKSRINPQAKSSNLRVWVCFEHQTSYWFDWDREILSHDCWGSFQAGIFPEPGPGFEWGTVTKWCDVTFSSHFVTFQVRCDAARFRKSFW